MMSSSPTQLPSYAENDKVPVIIQEKPFFHPHVSDRAVPFTSPVRELTSSPTEGNTKQRDRSSAVENHSLSFPPAHLNDSESKSFSPAGGSEIVFIDEDKKTEGDKVWVSAMGEKSLEDYSILLHFNCLTIILLGIFFVAAGSSGRLVRATDLSMRGSLNGSSTTSFFSSRLKNDAVHTFSMKKEHDGRSAAQASESYTGQGTRFSLPTTGEHSSSLRVEGASLASSAPVSTLPEIGSILQGATLRMHYGLVVLGVLSVVQGGLTWMAWYCRIDSLFGYCRILYCALLFSSCFILLLSWLQGQELSTSLVNAIESAWNTAFIDSPEKNVCAVEQYFLCSGFRTSCLVSENESSMVHYIASTLGTASPSYPTTEFSFANASDACQVSCDWNSTVNSGSPGWERRMLGYFITPEQSNGDGPFSTPCLERFQSFAGVTRTITIAACLSLLIHGCCNFFLFSRASRLL